MADEMVLMKCYYLVYSKSFILIFCVFRPAKLSFVQMCFFFLLSVRCAFRYIFTSILLVFFLCVSKKIPAPKFEPSLTRLCFIFTSQDHLFVICVCSLMLAIVFPHLFFQLSIL